MVRGSVIKRGKVWYAVWHQDGKQRWKSTGETEKGKARERLAGIVAPLHVADQARAFRDAAQAAEARLGDSSAAGMSVSDIWTEYETSPSRPDASTPTIGSYRSVWDAFARWIATERPSIRRADAITQTAVSDYARHLQKNVCGNSFNRHLGILRLVWKVSCKQAANPFSSIARKRAVPVSRRNLTIEELARISAATIHDPELHCLFALGIYTGLRRGDAVTLRWSEVDLALGLIRRIPIKTQRRTGKLIVIPIYPTLMGILQTMPRPPRSDFVLPRLCAIYRRRPSRLNDLLGKVFRAAEIETAGDAIPGRAKLPVRVSFHSLRHTFVTLLAGGGAPQAVTQALVAHASPAMTAVYTHVGADATLAAVRALPAVFGQVCIHTPQPTPQPNHLPEWVYDALAKMTADNWSDIRDRLTTVAPAPRPALPA